MTETKPRKWWLEHLAPHNVLPPYRNETAPLGVVALAIVAHSEFIRSYIRTALWATNDHTDDQGGTPLDENFDGPSDFDEAALLRIVQECLEFWEMNQDDLEHEDSCEEGTAGHDFFLTRNGHGAGFWDGDWPPEMGERLTEASQKFGESEPYVGDDGKLYVS